MKILNLTQHKATAEQIEAGVVDFPEDVRNRLKQTLTLPAKELADASDKGVMHIIGSTVRFLVYEFVAPEIGRQCQAFLKKGGYEIDSWFDAWNLVRPGTVKCKVMIGGAPYMMSSLEDELIRIGATPIYALSERVSVETTTPDGETRKISEFRHLGFIEATLRDK